MASAFNLCALIVHWRVEIPPGIGANESHGNDVRDPKWLLAVNGISLGLALIANISLLLNMARRVAFSLAQPITIFGWYIASFLLIGDLSGIIHTVKKPGQRRALTQAFYYAIFAASLYFFVATLMVVTVFGVWRRQYSSGFKLTTSQRTLMLQTISFMVYMLGGAGMYARIEGWMFLDALFFTNFTLLTVGIGDYAPLTHLGRGLLFPFGVGGIVILGLVIGSIRSLVLERGKDKVGSRMAEKKRKALVESLKANNSETLRPRNSSEGGPSELQRREEEFNLMRRIQEATKARQKWNALLVSGGAWLVLWFIGALVFYFAEHEQQWTYFQSLYFAYTTLLTIGYGDFKPFSNSGKAFFVIWSLLAVPALTIVISNMGDTVVKFIKDATLYIGEFTLLPGESSTRLRFRQIVGKLKKSHIGKEGLDSLKENADAASDSGMELDASSHIEWVGSSVHEHHSNLARELRKVTRHLQESPPRQYTFKEWTRFLKLIGEDEHSPRMHRQPSIEGPTAPDGESQQGKVQNGRVSQDEEWSWLGERSPMMSGLQEAQWVLEKLSESLEQRLKDMHQKETATTA